MDSHILLQISILILMLVLSGIFSSAETAFTTVNRIQLQLLAEEGNKKARQALWILEHSAKMLSAILICNNLVNIYASSLATTLTILLLGNAYVGAVTGILTLLILIFGEITPKSLASAYSLQLTLLYANMLRFLMKLLTPIIFIIEQIRIVLLNILRIDPNKKSTMTEEELMTLVDVGLEDGAIEDDEFEMIRNVFSLDESLAKDIMIPRIDMVFVSLDTTKEELLEIYREYNYTRYPVYGETRDVIIGTINIKDLILLPEDEPFHIRKILRKPNFTFEHKEVGTLLMEMQKDSISIIIVLDEYGSTSGMVTLEDILEEIVGEIRDEYDKDETDSIQELKPGLEYLVDGSTNLDDVNTQLELNLVSSEYDSIGGYLIETLDRLPKSGETITLADGTRFITEIVKRNRIEKVHLFLPPKTEEENSPQKS